MTDNEEKEIRRLALDVVIAQVKAIASAAPEGHTLRINVEIDGRIIGMAECTRFGNVYHKRDV